MPLRPRRVASGCGGGAHAPVAVIPMFGFFHAACGAASLLLGALIFAMRKGTRRHVWVGRAYVAAMTAVNLSSLWIYNLTGGPNVFHALAAGSLAMVAVGWVQVLRRRGRWLWRHYQYMAWSYVGLLAATTNEAFVRLPFCGRSRNGLRRGCPCWPCWRSWRVPPRSSCPCSNGCCRATRGRGTNRSRSHPHRVRQPVLREHATCRAERVACSDAGFRPGRRCHDPTAFA